MKKQECKIEFSVIYEEKKYKLSTQERSCTDTK